jgi:cysteine-rich repeat protein
VVDVAQSGNTISFAFRGSALSGTLDDANRLQVQDAADTLALDGDVSADGQLLNAATLAITLPDLTITQTTVLGFRCECVDGNFADGDGCDAQCQVEPCWTCSGTPSVCMPASDGSPCAATTCIAGETCTAGICGGGAPVSPCFDLSGTWAVHKVSTSPFGGGDVTGSDFTRTVRQRGSHIVVSDGPLSEYAGTIDPTTGTFGWTKVGGFYGFGLCGPGTNAIRMPFTGSITVPDVTFATTGTEAALGVSRCPLPVDVTEAGTRSDCVDGTPCSTGNACLTGETCLGGICQGGTPVTCEPCEQCSPTTGCVPIPQAVCPWPDRPARLTIKNASDNAHDRVEWSWRSAAPIGPLGDPPGGDGFTLCVYDNTVPLAQGLVFRSVIPGGGQCGTRPCWTASRAGTGFVYGDRSAAHDGTRSLEAIGGAPRGSRVTYTGKGAGLSGRPAALPALPLPSSVYVQLEADGGACVSALYDSDGVKKNDPVSGAYRAISQKN